MWRKSAPQLREFFLPPLLPLPLESAGRRHRADGFTCRPRQRGQGERRHLHSPVSQGCVHPLLSWLLKDSRGRPQRRSLLSPWRVVRLVDPLLGPHTGSVGCALWWRAAASSIRTVKRSCRWNARSWRCRRLIAAPGARSAMETAANHPSSPPPCRPLCCERKCPPAPAIN